MKKKILIILVALGAGGFFVWKNIFQLEFQPGIEKGWIKPAEQVTKAPTPQGLSPFAIAITNDGKYAYIGFDLSEAVFKVRLADLTVEAVADLSKYFPIENEYGVLDASGKKLFVYTPTWRKLLVLDTQTMSVIRTIDDIGVTGIFRSQYGPFLVVWDGGNTVKFVNTDTYEVTSFSDDRIGFLKIQEGSSNRDNWYVYTSSPDGTMVAGVYNYKAKSWNKRISFLSQVENEGVSDFRVLPNGQKAYVATFGGWYPDYHAYGWLYSVDLENEKVKVIPIDGAASALEASADSRWIYVGTAWPIPNENNLLMVDTASDTIVGPIRIGKNKYGRPYTQMNDLQIDPANPRFLYATNADGNALVKVDLDARVLASALVFSREDFQPNFFAKRPGQATGYIPIYKSAEAFELNLDGAAIKNIVKFPGIRTDAGTYDVAMNNAGNILVAQGESMLEVDPRDMRLLKTHSLPQTIGGLWHFVLSADRTKLYSVWQDPDGGRNYSDIFLSLDAATFQVKARLKLEGGGFNERPFELPDGSKLYALGGLQNGPITIQVIKTSDYTIKKTITFDEPGSLGISAGPYYPFTYDFNSHTLYVGTTYVVLAIDTDTDVVKKVIYLKDVQRAIGIEFQFFTYLNAIGLVYNPQENYLYIAHLDRSFISIYDLKNNRFLPQAISLNGYFPNHIFANDNYGKIYSLNNRSDSVSVIDVTSKTVEKVIDLHEYR